MLLSSTSPPRQQGDPGRRSALAAVFAAAAWWLSLGIAAADERGWDFQPIRITAVLAIDAPGELEVQLAEALPSYLERRVAGAIGPAWSIQTQVATGAMRQQALLHLTTMDDAPESPLPSEGDKLLLLAVCWKPEGFELTAREYDRYTQRWGVPIQRESRQQSILAEQLFALVWQSVAPLVRILPDPNDGRGVVLQPQGAALPRASADAQSPQVGDVFLPVLRRTTRGGELIEGSAQAAPWTFVEVVRLDGGKIFGRVHSSQRQPLAMRRQGRIEQVAISLRADPGDTRLRLESRTARKKPLIGYEVFAQNVGDEAITRIGSSDTAGRLRIPPGKSRVQTMFVKNGGQLLAKFPVVPGAEREIHVPLPDDDMRLAAESRLAAMREDVVDVVARRNILMARTRQKIEGGDFAAAQKLMQALDELPGRSQFNLTLTTAARLLRSDDPQIQRRIDQLFDATKTVLTQHLDLRPINQLHEELREAQRKGKGT